MAAQVVPLLLEAIDRWAPAQAAFGAVAAVLVGEAQGKRATSLVAAAARGVAQGLSAEARPIDEQEEILSILGVQSVGKAVSSVREAGYNGLAKRIQRLSKGRKYVAHPDAGLMDDVRKFACETAKSPNVVGPSKDQAAADSLAMDVDMLPPVPPFPSLGAKDECEVKPGQTEEEGEGCKQGRGDVKEMEAGVVQAKDVEGEGENGFNEEVWEHFDGMPETVDEGASLNELNEEDALQKREKEGHFDGCGEWHWRRRIPFRWKSQFWSIHKTVPKRLRSQVRPIQNRFLQAIQENNAQGVEEAVAELKALRGW